jgi:hypothetical protein
VAHAEDALHLAGGGKARFQAFDDAGERLVDDGGRAAGLADGRIAGRKIRHACDSMLRERATMPRRIGLTQGSAVGR